MGDQVDFVVPTGNFGNVLAGYYAKLLGLPVRQLVVASDRNNVLFDFLTTGTYNSKRPFFETTSPSMDILVSSNLERMLYYMSERDPRMITYLMNDLAEWGTYEVPPEMLMEIRKVFATGWADEDQVREMIADCWDRNHYVIDPHTACGYFVMQQMPADPQVPRVLLSTASPYKFPRVVNEALGLKADGTDFDGRIARQIRHADSADAAESGECRGAVPRLRRGERHGPLRRGMRRPAIVMRDAYGAGPSAEGPAPSY